MAKGTKGRRGREDNVTQKLVGVIYARLSVGQEISSIDQINQGMEVLK